MIRRVENIEVDYTIKSYDNRTSVLEQSGSNRAPKRITLSLVKHLKGGRSGDSVMMVQVQQMQDTESYIMKVFKSGSSEKKRKDDAEIDNHIRFSNLFESITPCPRIYMYGTLTGTLFSGRDSSSLGKNKYVLMEAVSPPMELGKYLRLRCSYRTQSANGEYESVDLISVMMQIFYILTKMKLANMSHCDLHPNNVMLVPNQSLKTLSFSHIGVQNNILPLGNHLVKVIDFGEGASGGARCSKRRSTSSAMAQTVGDCLGIKAYAKQYATILSERIGRAHKSDSDLSFFITMLYVVQHIEEVSWNLNKLSQLSNQLITGNRSRKKILAEFLSVLINFKRERVFEYRGRGSGRVTKGNKTSDRLSEVKRLARVMKDPKLTRSQGGLNVTDIRRMCVKFELLKSSDTARLSRSDLILLLAAKKRGRKRASNRSGS